MCLFFILLCLFQNLYSKPVSRGNGTGSRFSVGTLSGRSSYFQTDLANVNEFVTDDFGLDELDENIFMWGFEFNGYVDPQFSLGIQFVTGAVDTDGIVDFIDQQNEDAIIKLSRKVDYSIWYTGLTVSYIFANYGNYEIFSGGSLNYGNLDLILSQDAGDQSFGDLWESYDPSTPLANYNRSTHYETDIYVAETNIGIRYYLKEGVAISFSSGYNYGFTDKDGSINNGFESIKNVPDFDFEGVTYSVVLTIGN